MPSDTVVLVDGSSYLYRAFHALPPLTNSHNHPTGAMHGVLSMLRRLRKNYPDELIVVVFDPRGSTLRESWYPAYKANRPSMPPELAIQTEPLYTLIRALGYPLLQVPGIEADDVIGTLSAQAVALGRHVVISTGDKDFSQLVDDKITLINTMDNSSLDPAGVEAKFGVPPALIVDYLALVGDAVDNVPGVPKVGPKTAVKWLQQFGSVDSIIERAQEVPGKVGENLRDSIDQLRLSRRLVTILCDIDIGTTLSNLQTSLPDEEKLSALYRLYEFNTWLNELEHGADSDPTSKSEQLPEPVYEIVTSQSMLDAWLRRLKDAALFAFDTETTSLDYMTARLVGLSFACEPGEAAYVPLAHDYIGAPAQLNRESVLQQLKPLLEDPDRPKVGHNLKYDRNILLNHGIELRGIKHDTMLQSYVWHSSATRHDLDSVSRRYLNRETIHYEDVAGKGAKQINFSEVPIEKAGPYAAEDADVCLQLHTKLHTELQSDAELLDVYQDIEIPLVPVLADMERNGVLVDANLLGSQSEELSSRMRELEEQAYEAAGERFNLGSPKQIQHILYDKLELPVLSKTPKGQPSTAESALQELANEFDLPRLILDYRALSKLKSTYTEKLPRQINPLTGRVHTSYHQAVTVTGRLSSSDPNLQNIPIRSAEGRRIRRAFVAPAGCRLLAADYSQIELRIMAHLSEDPSLMKAFDDGMDVHKATAGEVFGVAPGAVTDDQRRAAKAINFGLIYGMSAFGLARQLGIERSAAQDYIGRYFARYPGVAAYMDRTREQARSAGFVSTVFGRRLHLPDINARNPQVRQYAERTAINAPMQGTAADIIKRAMISVQSWLIDSASKARLIMQVHDELVLEVSEDEIEAVSAAVSRLMNSAAALKVPLLVDIGVGGNWDEAH